VQNLTSMTCSATPISYKGGEILRVSRVVSESDVGQTDAATETEGSHTKCASLTVLYLLLVTYSSIIVVHLLFNTVFVN